MLEPSFRTSIRSDVSATKNMPKPKAIKIVQENSSSGSYSLNNIYEEMKPLPIEYKINHRFKASSVLWVDESEQYTAINHSKVVVNEI